MSDAIPIRFLILLASNIYEMRIILIGLLVAVVGLVVEPWARLSRGLQPVPAMRTALLPAGNY